MHALYAIASLPAAGTLPSELWDRLRPVTADCPHGPGDPRQMNYPAFETIPQPPGTWSWSFLSYDVDPRGRPQRVRLIDSSGNPALDRASVTALAHDRFAPGPGHRGCTYHFYHSGQASEERPPLPPETPEDTGEQAACRIDPKTIANLLDGSAYPPAFSRRKIAGVAAVQYDTAPWGAIGNVRIIAAEPAEAFGDAARNAIANARVAENDVGHRGCVRRVRFRLPSDPR